MYGRYTDDETEYVGERKVKKKIGRSLIDHLKQVHVLVKANVVRKGGFILGTEVDRYVMYDELFVQAVPPQWLWGLYGYV